MSINLDSIINQLEETKKKTDANIDYWMGREIQIILGYEYWENFEKVINKARMACENTEVDSNKHFRDTTKMVSIGSGAMRPKKDFYLTRYACYLIAMNGDSTKTQIGIAQGYFAIQTRKQEMFEKLIAEEKRIYLRNRVKEAVKGLHSVAKEAGVQKYALFHDAGYQGLYKMRLSEIKAYKGIKDDLLDRAGHTELAANEFRITQTKDKIKRDPIKSEKKAIDTHFNVGREVRNTIVKLGGIMPEDLSPEESIKKLERKHQREIKNLSKRQITN